MKSAVSEVDLVFLAERLGFTPKKIGTGKYNLKEMDSLVIFNRKTWHRFSGKGNKTGSDQVDFLEEFVEEVVSDVFISLWNTAERIDYEKYTSIKAYIGMIARNKAKDKIRAIKSWNLELYDDVLLIDNQAERLMEQKEQQRIIQKLLQQLKPMDREIFLLYYYRYFKIEEIAVQLNMNPQTIKTRLRRGRKTLRNALREEGYTVYENKD